MVQGLLTVGQTEDIKGINQKWLRYERLNVNSITNPKHTYLVYVRWDVENKQCTSARFAIVCIRGDVNLGIEVVKCGRPRHRPCANYYKYADGRI